MTASVAAHPAAGGHTGSGELSLWISIGVIGCAVAALTVWFVVALSAMKDPAGTGTRAVTNVQQRGAVEPLCVPAPSTRYC